MISGYFQIYTASVYVEYNSDYFQNTILEKKIILMENFNAEQIAEKTNQNIIEEEVIEELKNSSVEISLGKKAIREKIREVKVISGKGFN